MPTISKMRVLNPKAIDGLKPADKAYEVRDGIVPGLFVRVQPTNRKSFIMSGRFPGRHHATRLTLGHVGELTLVAARDKARAWLADRAAGTDPTVAAKRDRAAVDEMRSETLAAVVEKYIDQEVVGPDPANPNHRGAKYIIAQMRHIIIPLFGHRPIGELTADEIKVPIDKIAVLGTDRALVALGVRKALHNPRRPGKPARAQARYLFSNLDRVLRWAADSGRYTLKASPLAAIKKEKFFGPLKTRDRWLTEAEIAAVWHGAGKLAKPYRQIYRMLTLTGLRLLEVTEARWTEFDLEAKEWVIPAARMKGKNGSAKEHVVPLTRRMLKVLAELPRGDIGPYVFTITGGARPVTHAGRDGKIALLRQVASQLRTHETNVPHFTNHDIRRTFRSMLSKLRIDPVTAELLMAHKLRGVLAVYDRYERLDERREALVRWGDYLVDDLANRGHVVPLRAAMA